MVSLYMQTVWQMFPDRETPILLEPDAIAEVYWQLHNQPLTAWILEMDLRPFVENSSPVVIAVVLA